MLLDHRAWSLIWGHFSSGKSEIGRHSRDKRRQGMFCAGDLPIALHPGRQFD